jgi:arylsulfatase A-like enzyme
MTPCRKHLQPLFRLLLKRQFPVFPKVWWLACVLITMAIAENVPASSPQEAPPNIVFFLIDDLGYKDLEIYGAEFYETPNVDALAAQGTRFTSAYTTAAICAPARASAITGLHPARLGMWNHHHHLPDDPATVVKPLRDAGYQTWHVGKWHCGSPDNQTMPEQLGFDVNIGGGISWAPGSYFWPFTHPQSNPRFFVPHVKELSQKGDYLTDVLADQAVRLIRERDSSRPFFLNMWHYAVHNPLQGKRDLVEKYTKKLKQGNYPKSKGRLDPATGNYLRTDYHDERSPVYAAMIESLDDAVGAVIETLKQEGIFDNTLIVFFSDNGPTTHFFPCAPLMGGKNSTYEAGVRVPAFFVWPGKIPAKRVEAQPISISDIAPTVIEAAGASTLTASASELDGISLLHFLKGEASIPSRDFFWYFPDDRLHWAQRANAGILAGDGLKYILFFNGDQDEVYDIRSDSAERFNVAHQHPERTAQLRGQLMEFLRQHYESMPPPPEAYQKRVESLLELESRQD